MTEDEAIASLKELQRGIDLEGDHSKADSILCDFLVSLGYKSVVDEYELVDKQFSLIWPCD